MELPVILICIPVIILWTVSASDAVDDAKPPTSDFVTKALKPDNHTNTSIHNSTTSSNGGFFPKLNVDSSMIQRALYVLIGITIIGVLYFLVRAVRLKKPQRKKYGLLSNTDDNMEMAPLESDEEDTTVYEAKALRR